MPIEKIDIDQFLSLAKKFPVLDVRSPGEYNHAHIPSAFNLPLFTDDERRVVGTLYKQESREAAIKTGLDYFGRRMRSMVEFAESLSGHPRQLLVHCWRGGMRSSAVAWLLEIYGFKVYTLAGGYKKYRNWVLDTFSLPFSFTLIGGYTGSGKTYILEELAKKGCRVIDLEKIGSHKGSAFGDIGMPAQAGQEFFENMLSHELRALWEDSNHPIWLEDESQRLGHLNLPIALWNTMRSSPLLFIEIPFEERLKHIVREYGRLDRQLLANGIERIRKRLGPVETKTALQFLDEGEIEGCFRILLKYYDKHYNKALNSRDRLKLLLTKLECAAVDPVAITEMIFTKNVAAGNHASKTARQDV